MALQRHEIDQLMLSLFDKEATYKAGPVSWNNTSACSMIEFDDASAHEIWDDQIFNDGDLVGFEFPRKQQIARQSVRINYTEPRAKPNSLAGLIGLSLGTVTTAQDGALTAYRHKLTPANRLSVPSIGAQVKHDGGRQYKYVGIKSDGFTLSSNDQFLSLTVPLVGAGKRETASDAFAAIIAENSLLWADGKLFVVPASSPITVPSAPVQGATNLGGSAVDLSSRVINFSYQWANNLATDAGYRLGQGKERVNLHPARRNNGVVNLTIEVDDATEGTELDYYLNQTKLALEFNVDSGTVIAASGTFKFGMIMIVPLLQFRSVRRERGDGDREVLTYEANVLNDLTNDVTICWVYNAQSVYLA